MNVKVKFLLIVLLSILIDQKSLAQANPNKLEMGFNISQYQKDFGVGLNLISPYFIKQKVAIKIGSNLQWFENFNGKEIIWTSYQNIQLGIRSCTSIVENKIFIYGEAGLLSILQNRNFSSERLVFGGYGLFGFEFRINSKFAYFIELGSVGSGATADKIINKPIYSNGFLTNVGFRIGF